MRLATLLCLALLGAACGGSSESRDDTGSPDTPDGVETIDDGSPDVPEDADGDTPTEADDDVPDAADAGDTSVPDTADADADADGGSAPRADRVLFVGNSYTAANDLAGLVAALLAEAGHGGFTTAVAPGGYRLDQHADDADGTNGDTTLRDLLVTGPEAATGWDAIVLQQQSQIPGFPRDEPLWLAMVDGATTLRDLAAAAGAQTVLFLTWGYREGDAMNPTLYPDYSTMQERLAAGYEDLAARLTASGPGAFVAPVGHAYRSIHDAGPADRFAALYSPDDSHPSVRGSYLAACTIFATLTGTSPEGLSAAPAGIDDATRDDLQRVAASVVLGPGAPDHWAR